MKGRKQKISSKSWLARFKMVEMGFFVSMAEGEESRRTGSTSQGRAWSDLSSPRRNDRRGSGPRPYS